MINYSNLASSLSKAALFAVASSMYALNSMAPYTIAASKAT